MRIAKLGAGSEGYYLHTVAAGAEDHRRDGLEPDGAWLGRGAASLGLRGPVAGAPLTAVLGGRHPGTGEPLRPARSRVRVVGFDLTVAAPKSVSVLEGVGDPALGATVRAAHEAAVAGALGYVGREAGWARRHQGGRVHQVPVRGLVVAAFVHRTSRAGDPHLHSHVLVANLGEADDGTWSALDARGLYAHARTAGYLYQAGLRHELAQRLGARFGPVVNGVAQLAGVDPRVTGHLSRRRAEVEERLAAWGTATPAAAQAAALATRQAKPPARPEAELRAGWRDQVRALGTDPEALRPPASPASGPVPGTDEVASVVVGPGGPLAARATFGRRELVRAVADALPAGAPPTAVEDLAVDLVGRGWVVGRGPDAAGERWRGRSGTVVASGVTEPRWTTHAVAGAEEALGEEARRRRRSGMAVPGEEAVAAVLAQRPSLVPEQARVVEALLTSGAGVEALWLPSGPGGTDVLEAARAGWQAARARVVGVAGTRAEAARLEAATGIEGVVAADLVGAVGAGDGRGAVVAVRVEGVGPGWLATTARRLRGAKIVLVGSPGADGLGTGALRAVADRVGSVAVPGPPARSVPEGPRGPGVTGEEAAEVALDDGRSVLVGRTAAGVRAALVERWWRERCGGARAVMVAGGAPEVAELNRAARERLAAAGRLGAPVGGEALGLPGLAVGDDVMLRWARPGWGLGAGAVGEVVGAGGGTLVLRTPAGQEAVVPRAGLRRGQLIHAHAMGPADVARGRAGDRVLVLGGPELLEVEGQAPRAVCHGVLAAPAASRGPADDQLWALAEDRRGRPGRGWPHGLEGHQGNAPRTLARVGPELEALRAVLLADLPPDPRVAQRHLAEERRAVAAGLARAGDPAMSSPTAPSRRRGRFSRPGRDLRPGPARRWQEAAVALAAREADQEAALARRRAWLAAHGGDLARYAGLVAEAERRRGVLARAAEVAPGDHLLAAIGEPPGHPADRARWREGAAALEGFRERWGIRDRQVALGRPSVGGPARGAAPAPARDPTSIRCQRERAEAQAIVDDLARRLGRGRGRELGRGLERSR